MLMKTTLKAHFIQAVQEHQRIINSLCKIYYPEGEDQKDTKQDVILQLWKSYPFFRNESKISTWIYKVALNTILSKTKKEKRNVFTVPISDHLEKEYITYNGDDEVHQLQQIISLLHDVDKAIVILFLEGYNHKEIANTLNFTESNISTRFSRIKIRLQKLHKSTQPHELK